MKIISGKLKGRTVEGFNIEGTRPTMDRVKESVFASIQLYIKNSNVLDLFSGSGNYGFEAYSNGASNIYLNDKNIKCINVIKKNMLNFNLKDNFYLTNMDYNDCLRYYKNKNIKFDLIFLDPPYKLDVCNDIIEYIKNNDLLNKNGLIIVEVTNNNMIDHDNISIFKNKKYGEKYVFIYKNNI